VLASVRSADVDAARRQKNNTKQAQYQSNQKRAIIRSELCPAPVLLSDIFMPHLVQKKAYSSSHKSYRYGNNQASFQAGHRDGKDKRYSYPRFDYFVYFKF
jgi:hypothetical protein